MNWQLKLKNKFSVWTEHFGMAFILRKVKWALVVRYY